MYFFIQLINWHKWKFPFIKAERERVSKNKDEDEDEDEDGLVNAPGVGTRGSTSQHDSNWWLLTLQCIAKSPINKVSNSGKFAKTLRLLRCKIRCSIKTT